MLGRTPSQTVGPFFAIGLCRDPQNEVVPGGAVRLVGHVLDGAGAPVPDAVIELWQPGDGSTQWGRCGTDAEGRFEFVTARPSRGPLRRDPSLCVVFCGISWTRCYFDDVDDPVLVELDRVDRDTLIA